jgi:hypothetical protein
VHFLFCHGALAKILMNQRLGASAFVELPPKSVQNAAAPVPNLLFSSVAIGENHKEINECVRKATARLNLDAATLRTWQALC